MTMLTMVSYFLEKEEIVLLEKEEIALLESDEVVNKKRR